MSNRLQDKIVLITGVAKGIAKAHAEVFLQQGAIVIGADIDDELGQAVLTEFSSTPEQSLYLHLDISQEQQWQSVISTVEEKFGRLDCLLNIAGFVRFGGVEEEDKAGWDHLISVDQTGTLLGMKYATPLIRKSGGGSIVNMSSLFAILGSTACTAYHAAKGAVTAMTKQAAVELAKDNIRVNCISPGPVTTPNFVESPEHLKQQVLAKIPLGRAGDPKDIAYASVLLCSDECTFMTGSDIVIDGGWFVS